MQKSTQAGATLPIFRPCLVLALAVAALLNGGTSFKEDVLLLKEYKDPVYPRKDHYATLLQQLASDSTEQKLTAAAHEDFHQAIGFCRDVLNLYERGVKRSANIKLLIGATGALAGSVLAPALAAGGASKGAIALFAGISGMTNTLQTEFGQSGVSQDFYLSERRHVANALKEASTPLQPDDGRPRHEVLAERAKQLRAACVGAASATTETHRQP